MTRIYRQGIEIAAGAGSEHAGEIQLQQLGLEVMARPFPSIDALDLPTVMATEAFVHNWEASVTMETSYLTGIAPSSENVSEERTALQGRPTRVLSILWDGLDRDVLDRILVSIKKMTENQWVVPIYQDQIYLTENYINAPSNKNLYCNYLDRRMHTGGRLVVMKFSGDYAPSDVAFATVVRRERDYLVLDSNVGFDLNTSSTVIYPCMDVEYILDPEVEYVTNRLGRVRLDLQEVAGASALVPSWMGLPEGWGVYDGLPIFDPDHDWGAALWVAYKKEGAQSSMGRGMVTRLRGDRPRMRTKWHLGLDRENAFQVIRFFDSRLGRCLPFFTIDPEDVWVPQAIAAGYVDILPRGEFSDLTGYLDYVGLRLLDGTRVVREVDSVSDFGTQWRILFSEELPTVPNVSEVVGIARARKARFGTDSIEEEWITDDWCYLDVETLELLEEKSIGE